MPGLSGENLSSPQLLPQSECFVFLEQESVSPAQGYVEYCKRRDATGLKPPFFYLSTTITSGGYRRDEAMPVSEAIAANSRFAKEITKEGLLDYGIRPECIVLPSELRKVQGWKQADYLQFWLYIIRAIKPEHALELEEQHFTAPEFRTVAKEMEAGTADQKLEAYGTFVKGYLALKRSAPGSVLLAPHWKAPVLLPVFDNVMSLGCSAELFFAEHMMDRWGFMPRTASISQDVQRFLGLGAMIAGVDSAQLEARRAASEQAYIEYESEYR